MTVTATSSIGCMAIWRRTSIWLWPPPSKTSCFIAGTLAGETGVKQFDAVRKEVLGLYPVYFLHCWFAYFRFDKTMFNIQECMV